MDRSTRALSDLVAILERIEGKFFGPDTVRRIDHFIARALSIEADTGDHLTLEATRAAFESLVGSPAAHAADGRSLIVSVDPLRRGIAGADWQVGRPVTLGSERYIVARAPSALLLHGPVEVELVEQGHDGKRVLEIEAPRLAASAEPGALAHLWPGVEGRSAARQERNLLRDRLASTPWKRTDGGTADEFLPIAVAPLSPFGERPDFEVLDRSTLALPAELLSTGSRPARFSLEWPYDTNPIFSVNPVLLRRLPPGNGRYEHDVRTDSDGVGVVDLPTPDLRAQRTQSVMSVAVRRNDEIDAWTPCQRNGKGNGSGPTWHHDQLGGRIIVEHCEPDRDHRVETVIVEPGTARIAPGATSADDKTLLSVLDVPPPSNLLAQSVEPAGWESPAAISTGDLKRFIAEFAPFGHSLSLDPETLTVKRMLAPTESGLALTLNLTIGARTKALHGADIGRCESLIRSFADRLLPLPIPSLVKIEGAS